MNSIVSIKLGERFVMDRMYQVGEVARVSQAQYEAIVAAGVKCEIIKEGAHTPATDPDEPHDRKPPTVLKSSL